MDRVRIGLIGYGYWGPNLIRNFGTCPLTEMVAVCDANPARRAAVGRSYPGLATVESLDELLELPLDAVAIREGPFKLIRRTGAVQAFHRPPRLHLEVSWLTGRPFAVLPAEQCFDLAREISDRAMASLGAAGREQNQFRLRALDFVRELRKRRFVELAQAGRESIAVMLIVHRGDQPFADQRLIAQ